MIRILLSTRLGERRMTQSELARATGIRSQTINELYHDFAERVSLDDLDLIEGPGGGGPARADDRPAHVLGRELRRGDR